MRQLRLYPVGIPYSQILASNFRYFDIISLNQNLSTISSAGYLRKPTISSISTYISASTANAVSLIETISPTDNYLRQKFLDFYFLTQHFQVCNNVTSARQNPLFPQSYLAETEDGSGSHKFIQNNYLLLFICFIFDLYI